jgi:hypothetical protein
MAQCSNCLKLFASQRYLTTHLHHSPQCLSALTNRGIVRSHSTLEGTFVPSGTGDTRVLPHESHHDAVAQVPLPVNALGDVVLLDDDSSSSSNDFPFTEMDDHASTTSSHRAKDENTSSNPRHDSPLVDTERAAANNAQTIHPNESFNVPTYSDDKDIPMLRIITAVREHGAPLKLVGVISKILREESQYGRLDINRLTTHQTGIRRIQKMYPSLPLPHSITISHERTSQEMNSGAERPSLTFPTFSFLRQLTDLLNDHVFSDIQSLVVDPSNRWDYYKKDSCRHSPQEIQDGDWFQSIVQHVKSNPSSDNHAIPDFLFGIQGYVDKTGTDVNNRYTVEPLVFTLTLFTNKTRNSAKHWRVLALLPASSSRTQKKKYAFGASVRNYHIALSAALEEFIALQKNPPIVRLRLGDQFRLVRARLYWVNTIADGLANEQLVGRIQNRTSSPRLSRACHCPQHLADDNRHHCKLLRQTAMERLVVAALGPLPTCQEWTEYLNSHGTNQSKRMAESALQTRKKLAEAILKEVFGQHVVDLVWFRVDQGPNPRGCFGSTPVDPMHAFEEGIVPNILSVILDPLPDSAKSNLDAIAMNIVASNRWDADYPRMNFSGGFSSLTQLTADEKVGKLCLLWIIMQTPLGNAIIQKRCSPTFDSQRATAAARFSGIESPSTDDNSEDEDDETIGNTIGGRSLQGYQADNLRQAVMVENWLNDYHLGFVVAWTRQMSPLHQNILRKTVYNICALKHGKSGKRHVFPPNISFLDRRTVTGEFIELYADSNNNVRDGSNVPTESKEAQYSLDCSVEELQNLIEMLLSFHATYKYGRLEDKVNFDEKVRTMMALIKAIVRRGDDTKNWSISKFHELLHFDIDTKNFGSLANIDAGKGEHGLKTWVKLPSKTVRNREANLYYMDMAHRIYENRLLGLATSTLLPNKELATNEEEQRGLLLANETDELEIELCRPLLPLNEEGSVTILANNGMYRHLLSCTIDYYIR